MFEGYLAGDNERYVIVQKLTMVACTLVWVLLALSVTQYVCPAENGDSDLIMASNF